MDRMLSVERVKELLSNPSLSDEEAEVIRDELHSLAEIVVEHLKNLHRSSPGATSRPRVPNVNRPSSATTKHAKE